MTKEAQNVNNPHFFPNGHNLAAASQSSTMIFDFAKPLEQRLVRTLPTIPGTNHRFVVTDIAPDDQLLIGVDIHPGGSADGIYTYSMNTNEFTNIVDYGTSPIWIDGMNKVLFFHKGKILLLRRRDNSVKELDASLHVDTDIFHVLSADKRTFCYIKVESESDVWQATME